MLILRIKEKGFYLEIPGTTPTRTPADIDISKCNLSIIPIYLKKLGIKDFQILTDPKNIIEKTQIKIKESPKKTDSSFLDKRFSKLEKMMELLLQKEEGKIEIKKEQNTNSMKKVDKVYKNKTTEPDIEELDVKYIPKINTSEMKMKGGSKKVIKQDKVDLDDSADLLSRIMGTD